MIRAEPTGNGIWHVELRRPEKRNALGVDLYASLAACRSEVASYFVCLG